ncbi:hypothetical protein QWJ90_01265 [Microbacterium oryzae]|uniref:hypothetical protein n=1 Tax=Microbacterium oryzae TaxID=743009 RepID=UPI0025B0ECA2|nr:hypothetical protein [Microbacterium oryzae]MDN3309551.1 hypothetical protein [Microbacterium oryzae]
MALVTITYNAWNHNREVIPASRQPRVGFRPLQTSFANGLMTNREVWGSLDPTTGAGSVQLESTAGLLFVPFMDWLTDGATSENDRTGYCEWRAIFPGKGGPIEELPPAVHINGVLYGWGAPPEQLHDVVYFDLTGPKVRVWGPEGGNA